MEHQTELESKLPAAQKENGTNDIGGNTESKKRTLAQDEQGREEEKNDEPKKLKREEIEAEQDSEQTISKSKNNIQHHRKMKKCALLLSYCGVGYAGMQINPGVLTIEEVLFEALHKVKAITDEGKQSPGKMSFQRCARTDKGVSAARQVVNLKMLPEKTLLPEINNCLPPAVRVVGFRRVTKGFDCKVACTARTYEYLTPTYAFASELYTTINYRINEERIKDVNEILSRYVGTHNFHNFTSQKAFKDPSAFRYIMSFECGKPFERDGHEFVVLTVKGQSFMLHQIRKMVGLAISILRHVAPKSAMDVSWKNRKVEVPRAPALGLMLARVHFNGYNRRYGNDGIHDTLEWEECEEDVEAFKEKYIYSHIIEKEISERSMMRWLKSLYNHDYSDIKAEEAKEEENEQNPTDKIIVQKNVEEQRVSEGISCEEIDKASPQVSTNSAVEDSNSNNSENKPLLEASAADQTQNCEEM